MKPSQIKQALRWCYANERPAFLWGPPGIGKSDLVRQLAAELKISLIDKRLSQSDPTELKGYPWPDQTAGVMSFLRDGELPTKGKGILFLDEFNNAPSATQAPAYQLILDRKLGSYTLPKGWVAIAAGNRITDRSVVHAMAAALSNRFIHLDVEPDLEDWVSWAKISGVNPSTIAYLRFRSMNLFTDKFTPGMRAFPTPRTWVYADRIAHDDTLDLAVKRGLLGGAISPEIAAEYEGFLRDASELPDVDVILHAPEKASLPKKPSTMYAVITRLETITSSKTLEALLKYVARLPKEFEVMFVQLATTRDKALLNTGVMTRWIETNHSYMV